MPIFFKGKIQIVDPITRQTYPQATVKNCSDRIKNFSQIDMDKGKSWHSLTPGMVHPDTPAIFGPQDVKSSASHFFVGLPDAGIYTQIELRGFWDSILINAASRKEKNRKIF